VTISYTLDIYCDHCGNWIRGVTSKSPNTVRASLYKAKKAGWSRDTKSIYTDLCPQCLNKVRKEPK
jgi:hypothetical protein